MDITNMKSVIIGAGTYGEVYLSYLQESGVNVIGFLDDNENLWGQLINSVPVLGGTSLLEDEKSHNIFDAVYCPIGNNKIRVEILKKAAQLGYNIPNYIHPSVIISPNVSLGQGVYILLGSNIMPHTIIDDYVMISMGVNVAHHSYLGKGCFLSTGVNFGASIHAEDYSYIGLSSTIMTGVKTLGADCLIGAGAVVIKDVPERAVMVGVPAKVLRIKE